jgi:hypothetical protein
MVRVAGLCVVAVVVGGCQLGPTASIGTRFDPRAAAYIQKPGKGRIEGQAFLRRDQGRLVTAAGERVFLIPATAYAVERFERMFGGDRRSYYGSAVEDPPPEYLTYRKETKVDMSGRFSFESLAPGRYIVATRVFWTEPKSFFTHGGAMYDVVDVKGEETTTAIVSGK